MLTSRCAAPLKVTILNKATLNIYPASVTLLALNVAQTLFAFHLASLVGKAALPRAITLPKVREHAFLALLNVVALTMKTVCLGVRNLQQLSLVCLALTSVSSCPSFDLSSCFVRCCFCSLGLTTTFCPRAAFSLSP